MATFSIGIPYTLLHGVFTCTCHLKVFGSTAYLRLEDRYREKLSPQAFRYIFIGYYDDGQGYWILYLATGTSPAQSTSRLSNLSKLRGR
jgi:hypothetical protein